MKHPDEHAKTASVTPSGRPRTSRLFLVVFAALAAAGLLSAALLVIAIDPFFRYHAPVGGFPYVIDNQLSQNIGMAEHFSYDAVITGSSMTMNFDTEDFTAQFPDHPQTLKLTMNGALPHDIRRILSAVFERSGTSHRGPRDPAGAAPTNGEAAAIADAAAAPVDVSAGSGIREVFIAIDPATWTAGTEEVKYPYPEYLYDRNPFNDVKYLWNREVLLDYCLRPMIEREGTPLNRIYMTEWEDDLYYTLDWILAHYEEPAENPAETPADAYLADTDRNLAENLLPWIDAHPETTWYFFYPPYSILYWHDVIRENHLEATLAQERLIAERLLSRPNTRIYQFQDWDSVILNINGGYMDEIHFRPEINHQMVYAMASSADAVESIADMDRHLERLRLILQTYDQPIEALR